MAALFSLRGLESVARGSATPPWAGFRYDKKVVRAGKKDLFLRVKCLVFLRPGPFFLWARFIEGNSATGCPKGGGVFSTREKNPFSTKQGMNFRNKGSLEEKRNSRNDVNNKFVADQLVIL